MKHTFLKFRLCFLTAVVGTALGFSPLANAGKTISSKPVKASAADANYSNEGRNAAPADENYSNEGRNHPAPEEDYSYHEGEGCQTGLDKNLKCIPRVPEATTPNATANTPTGEVLCAGLKDLSTKCETDVNSAISSCDNDQDSGIQAAKSQLSDFAVGIGSQLSVQKPCSGIAKYVGLMNGAVVAFAGYCNNSRDTCMTSCNQLKIKLDAATAESCGMNRPDFAVLVGKSESQLAQCRSLSAKVDQAKVATTNLANTVRAAKSCTTDTQAATTPYNANTAPTECADPNFAAANPICFCSSPANLNNPRCGGVARASSELANGAYTPQSASSSGALPNFAAAKEAWKPSADLKGSGGPGEDPGGKKGGRALESGSGGGKGGADSGAGAGAAAGPGMQVNNGFRGGSGSGGGGSYSSGGGGAGGMGSRNANGAAGGQGPDLRQFLPGGKFAPGSRGVAGMTGPDGITGPHDNIFVKIKNRYQAQRPTFLGN